MTPNTLAVAEIFGPTVQGEGPSLGRQATFLRLGACNLTCRWCDTPYTWDARRYDLRSEISHMPVGEILTQLAARDTGRLVITGGEPMLQQRRPGWRELLIGLHDQRWAVEIETNGTRSPTGETASVAERFNVSPKLSHSGDQLSKRIDPEALAALRDTGKAIFKFVCRNPADLDEVAHICKLAALPDDLIWIMPEGTWPPVLLDTLRQLAQPVVDRGWNLTTRLHVLAWGDERGR